MANVFTEMPFVRGAAVAAKQCAAESAAAAAAALAARAAAKQARGQAAAAQGVVRQHSDERSRVGAKYCGGMVELGVKSEADAQADLAVVRAASPAAPVRGTLLQAYRAAGDAAAAAQSALSHAQGAACAAEAEADAQDRVSAAAEAKRDAADQERRACRSWYHIRATRKAAGETRTASSRTQA
jgi:hypothetical protein